VPIAYSQSIGFIRYWLIKVFGEIAINRLYANVTWDFFVWGLFLSFGLVLFDRLISNKLNHPMVRRILNIVLIITGLAVVALETKWSLISTLHKNTIASVWLNSWLGVNYYWFLIPVIVLALVVLYQERRSAKWHQFFVFTPIKNYIPVLLAAFLVIFFLFSPNFKPFWHFLDIEFAQQYFMKPSRNHTGKLVTYSRIGGKEVVDFIKTNVPSKSVFLADKTATSVLPLVTDQYMAADIKSFGEQRYRRVYKDTMSHSVRLEEVVISNGDYLLLSNPNQKNSKYFDTHKNIYKKIYSGKHAAIYKINWPAANYEYQLMMQEKNAKAKIQTNL